MTSLTTEFVRLQCETLRALFRTMHDTIMYRAMHTYITHTACTTVTDREHNFWLVRSYGTVL